jgi:hypothetical protein
VKPSIGLLALAIAWVGPKSTAIAAPPNILFVLTDDQGWPTLGCYGSKHAPTPHLDGLAKDGVRFTSAYVTPQCTPTRAALLTGQHPARSRLWHVIPRYGYPRGGHTLGPIQTDRILRGLLFGRRPIPPRASSGTLRLARRPAPLPQKRPCADSRKEPEPQLRAAVQARGEKIVSRKRAIQRPCSASRSRKSFTPSAGQALTDSTTYCPGPL